MAKQPNFFKNALTKLNQGYGVVPMGGRYGTSDPRGSTSGLTKEDLVGTKMDSDYSARGPSFLQSAGNMSSEGASDFQHEFAGSGIVTAAAEDPEAPGYTSRINEIGNFWIRDPSGKVIYSHGKWVSDRDYEAYKKAQEAAKEEETTPEADTTADKLEEISEKTFDRGTGTGTAGTGTAAGAQAEYTKAKSESVGQAEDEAIEMIKKGRRATILTKPGGLLGTGEEEGKTRRRRALIGR